MNDLPAAADVVPAEDGYKTGSSPARGAAVAPPSSSTGNVATPPRKDERTAAESDPAFSTPPRSAVGPYRDKAKNSSCKRRRLASEDEENFLLDAKTSSSPTAAKINYESRNGGDSEPAYEYDSDEESDDEDEEDYFVRELARMRQNSILRKMRSLNYEEAGGDRLLHTCATGKLYEHVKDYDVVENRRIQKEAEAEVAATGDDAGGGKKEKKSSIAGEWVYRGSGCVKFIKCMEEGYNLGMVRMELTKNGTLETLMRHELTVEDVKPMPSKKGKAYTWRASDWAYRTATRTFALRFDGDVDAVAWREHLERSKANNRRVRRGLDVPDLEEGRDDDGEADDFCSAFRDKLRTAAAAAEDDEFAG